MESKFDLNFKSDIHKWANLNPDAPQYSRYSSAPNIIYCGHKIHDIYWALAQARANLIFLNNKNWGDYTQENNDYVITFLQSQHIQNASLDYRSAVDFSWQLLYLYVESNSLVFDEETYNALVEKNKGYKLIKKSIKNETKLRTLFTEFFDIQKNTNGYEEIRLLTNYMKHGGTIYFKEQNIPYSDGEMLISVNGEVPKMITRKTLLMKNTVELLVKFDNAFTEYLDEIFKEILPIDYSDGNINVEGLLNL